MIPLLVAEGPMGLTPLLFSLLSSAVFLAATVAMVMAYFVAALLIAGVAARPWPWRRALKLGMGRAVGGLLASWLALSGWLFGERAGLALPLLLSMLGLFVVQVSLWWMLIKGLTPESAVAPVSIGRRVALVLPAALMLPIEFAYAYFAGFFGAMAVS